MFRLLSLKPIDMREIPNERLRHLYAYWLDLGTGRSMPNWADFDPLAIPDNLGRMHLLVVERPGVFRYQIYGSGVTNPDRVDMTGRTTMDYADREFATMVTAHLSEVVKNRTPTCYRIGGDLNGQPYEYIRIALPLGDGRSEVSHLLVGTQRINVQFNTANRPIVV